MQIYVVSNTEAAFRLWWWFIIQCFNFWLMGLANIYILLINFTWFNNFQVLICFVWLHAKYHHGHLHKIWNNPYTTHNQLVPLAWAISVDDKFSVASSVHNRRYNFTIYSGWRLNIHLKWCLQIERKKNNYTNNWVQRIVFLKDSNKPFRPITQVLYAGVSRLYIMSGVTLTQRSRGPYACP